MTVQVHFFGHYSDYFASQPVAVVLPENATVRELAQTLAGQDARLARLEAHCRFAVEEEYAALDTVLAEGNTVAVLPPMSGG